MELVRVRAKIQTQEICALNIIVILSMILNWFYLSGEIRKLRKTITEAGDFHYKLWEIS